MILSRADSLLSGNRSYDAPTGSYVMFGGKFTFQKTEDGGNELDPITRFKINLPKSRARLKLLVDREIDSLTKTESQRDAQVTAGQIQPDDNPYVALRGVARETLNINLAADVGMRLRASPDPFGRVRARRVFSVGSWEVPLSETLMYRHIEKGSAVTELGFLRSIGPGRAFGSLLNVTWRDEIGGFDLGVTAGLAWRIDERSLVACEAGVYGQSEPSIRDTAYSLAVTYRRKIYRDWLILHLRPQGVYLPEESRVAPIFVLQLETYIGHNYLDKL
jgi:hypothetical protein